MVEILRRLVRSPFFFVLVVSLAIVWYLPADHEIWQELKSLVDESVVAETQSDPPPSIILTENEAGKLPTETRYSIMMNPKNFHQRPDYAEVAMVDHNGVKYKCFVPPASSSQMKRNQTDIPTPEEVLKLLEPLNTSCLYRMEGWWTYEFCHLRHLRQFHEDKNSKTNYILGQTNSNELPPTMIVPPNRAQDSPALFVQTYSQGTTCDLNNVEREATVQFRCTRDTQTIISQIKEPSSCKYVVVVTSPVLCSIPYFSLAEEVFQPIACNKI